MFNALRMTREVIMNIFALRLALKFYFIQINVNLTKNYGMHMLVEVAGKKSLSLL